MDFYKQSRFIFLIFATITALIAVSGLPIAKASNGIEVQITTGANSKASPAIYGNRIVWIEDGGQGRWNVFLYDISKGQISPLTKEETRTSKFNLKIYGDNIVWSEYDTIITVL